eukprot:442064-Amphidinium_carterae.1
MLRIGAGGPRLDVLRLGIVPQAHLQRFNKVFGLVRDNAPNILFSEAAWPTTQLRANRPCGYLAVIMTCYRQHHHHQQHTPLKAAILFACCSLGLPNPRILLPMLLLAASCGVKDTVKIKDSSGFKIPEVGEIWNVLRQQHCKKIPEYLGPRLMT